MSRRKSIRQQVDEGVALVVALCDALALIGDPQAIGKLYQAMELAHRRIRVEAAAALAKLGESAGASALVALAAEPVVRLRVLNSARGTWPERPGGSPIHHRYGAGRGDGGARTGPTDLLRHSAGGTDNWWMRVPSSGPGMRSRSAATCSGTPTASAAGEYSNVAIAGPLVHAFAADLSDLPPDDIYAAYAGWHVEHESIYEVPVEALTAAQRTEQDRFERRLREAGYAGVQQRHAGAFLR